MDLKNEIWCLHEDCLEETEPFKLKKNLLEHEQTIHNINININSICEQCDTHSTKVFPKCGKCKIVHYCNIECQRLNWKKHKLICL